jgi:hypothetical protein
MKSNVSKYRIVERPRSFLIEGDERVPVCVTIGKTGFYIERAGERQLRLFPEFPDTSLIAYRALVDGIVQRLMSDWSPPEGKRSGWGVHQWALAQTKRAIASRIYAEWQRLIAKACPQVVAAQKAVFAASYQHCPLLLDDDFYQDPLLVGDVVKYRAAAAIVPLVEELLEQEGDGTDPLPGFDQLLEGLHDWQALLSPSRQRYRSLSRTLMALPGGIPAGLLTYLREITLERPVRDRVELIALLMALDYGYDPESTEDAWRVFMHARRADIVTGMQLVNQTTLRKLSSRRARDIGFFVRYVLDYPGKRPRRLSSLINLSVKWHKHISANFEPENSMTQMPTMEPPIPLPGSSSIQFLDTVSAIYKEAHRMDHCVYLFVRRAVEGRRFFFHVDHAGEQATVEVDELGQVVQASGPRNSDNTACAYGSRVLGAWGSRFTKAKEITSA